MITQAQRNEDRRIFERFKARFPAKFKDTREDFGTKVILREASAQGAKITTKERLFMNDKVSLEVAIPDGHKPMVLKGEVIWARHQDSNVWDVGLKFHKISLMSMSRLYSLATNQTFPIK